MKKLINDPHRVVSETLERDTPDPGAEPVEGLFIECRLVVWGGHHTKQVSTASNPPSA